MIDSKMAAWLRAARRIRYTYYALVWTNDLILISMLAILILGFWRRWTGMEPLVGVLAGSFGLQLVLVPVDGYVTRRMRELNEESKEWVP